MRLALPIAAAVLLSACASFDGPADAELDPNHKQFMTGSRIAHKGRGGPDAVKTISQQGIKEQMRNSMEREPQSK